MYHADPSYTRIRGGRGGWEGGEKREREREERRVKEREW